MIDIINVHKGFGEQRVLRGVNLIVEKGESMTVIGGSGSGKSVLLKHIIGLLFPDQGRVIIDGQELNNLDQQA
jgi:phospholipid/cholesterol/gamma-HCH transport system ATP-binding protein